MRCLSLNALVTKPIDGPPKPLFERHARNDAQDLPHPAVIRNPARDVLITGAINGLLRNEGYSGPGTVETDHHLRELLDAYFFVAANIDNISHCLLLDTRSHGCPDGIINIGEAAGLLPVANDR